MDVLLCEFSFLDRTLSNQGESPICKNQLEFLHRIDTLVLAILVRYLIKCFHNFHKIYEPDFLADFENSVDFIA